jgi:hypothetical protein
MRAIATVVVLAWGAACSDAGPKGTLFQGSFSTPYVETYTKGGAVFCTITFTATGSVEVRLDALTGQVTGSADVDFAEDVQSVSPAHECGPQAVDHQQGYTATVSGPTNDIRFSAQRLVQGEVQSLNAVSFVGSLSGTEINGSLTITRTDGPHPSGMISSASATVAVVLR